MPQCAAKMAASAFDSTSSLANALNARENWDLPGMSATDSQPRKAPFGRHLLGFFSFASA